MRKQLIENIALNLKNAERTQEPIADLSIHNLTLDEAYQIQLANINRELRDGRKIVGKKIGLTSKAMQDMLGVDQPDYGHLLDTMQIKDNVIQIKNMIQPKVEAEIAFVLKKSLNKSINTIEEVLDATDYVLASLEIVDSRIKDWKIGLLDTVSDNASSGVYVLGTQKIDVKDVDLKTINMKLYKNDDLINEGKGSAALGDPAYCVAWLADKMNGYGVVLMKNEVILSGALSAAVSAQKGDHFKAEFDVLGSVEVYFK